MPHPAGDPPVPPASGATPFTPFDAEGGLILATRLPGEPGDFDKPRRGFDDLDRPDDPPPLWVHLDRTRPRAQRWLRERAGLDAIVADALLAEETRPRADAFGQGLLVILRGINMNPGAEPDELISVRMWFEPARIITLRQHRFQTIADLRVRAEAGKAPATAGLFLAAVAQGLASRITPTIGNLEEMLDDIEDEMLDRESDDPARRSQLSTIRRQAITYRRYLVPQRDALSALANGRSELLSQREQAEIRVALEQTTRVCEALEELRDRAAVTQEEMRARHEARIGRTLYLLTIVATVMLPLSFITGLLGINVGGIPLADSALGFTVVCVFMLGVAAIEVWWFRRKRWL
ncbi:MAG: zinc transporter ZntB [Phycisphaerales bacterium]